MESLGLRKHQRLLNSALLATLLLGFAAPALGEDCSHIRILGRADADEVHYSFEGKIFPASREQRKVVRDAFALVSPLLCRAVQRVVFVFDPDKKSVSGRNKSNDRQDLLYLNAAAPKFQDQILASSERARVEAMQTVIHEAAHAASRLLYTRSEATPPAWLEWRPDEDLWSSDALSLADKAIANTRLEKGLFQEWQRLHDSFARAGLADNYYGDDWTGVLALAPGFASAYGGEDVAEDIAEIVGWAQISKLFGSVAASEAYPDQNQACLGMQKESGPGIPGKLAAVFAKVGFAQSLGLITDDAYKDCVGNLKIRGNDSGFFTIEDGQQIKHYGGDVKGRIGQIGNDDSYFFELDATGTIGIEDEGGKPAKIRLTLEISAGADSLGLVSFPRGLYHIGPGRGAFNTLQITYQDQGENKIGIEIWEADVLIGRSSSELVEGAVFIKKYINYTELIKLPVPPKKPRIITFRKDNR